MFLNNCIGSLNYEIFMALLLLYILFLLNNIAQAVWVFVVARNDEAVRRANFTEWMDIVIIIICFLQLVATGALLSFHCYISCCLDLTTIAFYQSDTASRVDSNKSSSGNQEMDPNFYESPIRLVGSRELQATNENLNKQG